MALGSILFGVALVVVVLGGGRVYNELRRAAAEDGEDDSDPRALGWQLGLGVMSGAVGVLAVLSFWKSIPPGDYSFGGMIFILAVPVVFVVAYRLAFFLLRMLGESLSGRARAGLVASVLAVAAALLFVPAQEDSAKAARQRAAEEQARREADLQARLASLEVERRMVPHAPPGVVPEMLALQREDTALHVTNLGAEAVQLTVHVVLPRGSQWDRCSAWVEFDNCAPGAGTCTYTLAKDGTRVPSPGKTYAHYANMQPGQRLTFSSQRCGERFAAGAAEFIVWSIPQRRHVFKSDSAFVP